jgi:DNA uptake protein ComE-like DNA-binding protein
MKMKTTSHHAATRSMVDLNSASKEELAKLPGVSDDLADKIIAARPLKTRSELLSKKIVTRAEYRKIRSSVTAKQ